MEGKNCRALSPGIAKHDESYRQAAVLPACKPGQQTRQDKAVAMSPREMCRAEQARRCRDESQQLLSPPGLTALEHPHPGPHVLEPACDSQGHPSAACHQDAGIVRIQLGCPDSA